MIRSLGPLRARLAALLLAAALLGGCVEAEETWSFDDKGGGTYALTVRWNADLWRRVTDVLGRSVMKRLHGRPFPLRAAYWRDGLTGLPGVTINELGERDTDSGLREIRLRLTFKRIQDLLRWEVLTRRTVRITQDDPAPGEARTSPKRCRFHMEPITRAPVLDRIAALLDAVEKPPPPAEGAPASRDPPPLARLGIEPSAGEMVWRMVKRPLSEVELKVRIRVPGRVTSRAGRAEAHGDREVRCAWDFAALREADTDRTVRFQWAAQPFDQVPRIEHEGDRARP